MVAVVRPLCAAENALPSPHADIPIFKGTERLSQCRKVEMAATVVSLTMTATILHSIPARISEIYNAIALAYVLL